MRRRAERYGWMDGGVGGGRRRDTKVSNVVVQHISDRLQLLGTFQLQVVSPPSLTNLLTRLMHLHILSLKAPSRATDVRMRPTDSPQPPASAGSDTSLRILRVRPTLFTLRSKEGRGSGS
ncbi:unnamed protein product [Pleuronectes platessa]|uniref:Uncharacterized protein n=1 Tax=Pleuronectes platessa TaxID=8262 RepID=A0A9N7UJ14_PLEPL|nr:unnamed protein product [Pleuronectes platessa]